ncbi:MarR family winged helix-turn-helix transcriptional regulator [Streptomyces sp. NPDC003090]|uniref:MarR family winged helix-turn-helix transcriptional regulator n=1 Tax=Streptomyces sp. NPDC003090 TaxID=3154274 RepID=UPI0037FA4BB6
MAAEPSRRPQNRDEGRSPAVPSNAVRSGGGSGRELSGRRCRDGRASACLPAHLGQDGASLHRTVPEKAIDVTSADQSPRRRHTQIEGVGVPPSGAAWGRVSHALFRAGRLHRVAAGALLRRVGLYPGQELLLMLLWDEDHRAQADLIRALDVDASTVTKMLQRLEQAGFVTRCPSPTDRRAAVVSLTDSGRALREEVADLWRELEEAVTALLDEGEADVVTGLLDRIEEGLQQRLSGMRGTG